jgi:ectoine hydroxylase-related dioxygenase (phytanoyl-CoA dioxygenase family)
MAIHPVILAVMDEFLLKGCRQYQLNLTQAIQIGPGEPQQIMHPDDPLFPFVHPGYEAMINCMWAVDEFTSENGATNVVPGSHKWERVGLIPEREPVQDEITQGAMPAGSVLIYFGSLLHCGGANRSAKPRTGIVLSYCQGWLRQSENQYLAVPLEIAKTLPERLQRLLGYFVHEPNLGQIEGRDPIELLQGKTIVNAGFEEFLPAKLQPLLDQHKARLKEAA